MSTRIKTIEEVKLKNPIMVEGLPGVGNIGRIAAGYLIDELKATKFAVLHSSHFYPFAVLHEEVAELLKNEFYYWKDPKGKNDLVILIGDTQASEPTSTGHYEVSREIVKFAKSLGVKEIITLGGFPTGQIEKTEDIEVLGAVNDKKLLKKYGSYGIDFKTTSARIGTIVGATGLIVGLAKEEEIDAVALMGETTGFPIITDPRSSEKILKVLIKILGIELDLKRIDTSVKEMEDFLNNMEKVQQKALKELTSKEGDKVSYIG